MNFMLTINKLLSTIIITKSWKYRVASESFREEDTVRDCLAKPHKKLFFWKKKYPRWKCEGIISKRNEIKRWNNTRPCKIVISLVL